MQNRIEGTNTIYFIPREEVPFETKKVTYPKSSAISALIKQRPIEHISQMEETCFIRADIATPTATITTSKCLFNSVVSTPKAKFVLADNKKFTSTTLYQIQNI